MCFINSKRNFDSLRKLTFSSLPKILAPHNSFVSPEVYPFFDLRISVFVSESLKHVQFHSLEGQATDHLLDFSLKAIETTMAVPSCTKKAADNRVTSSSCWHNNKCILH
jgi:hypothetical protein